MLLEPQGSTEPRLKITDVAYRYKKSSILFVLCATGFVLGITVRKHRNRIENDYVLEVGQTFTTPKNINLFLVKSRCVTE